MTAPKQYDDTYEAAENLGAGDIAKLTETARHLEAIDSDIEAQEERLNELKAQRKHIAETVLPVMMEELDLSELKLRDGALLQVKDVVTAGIPKDMKETAFNWLRANGFGGLIKRKVVVEFGRGKDNEAGAFVDNCVKAGLNPSDNTEVNYQTLGAFVREQLADGKDLPMDLLGVNRFRRAEVKRAG
jgi:hypothetical protein